MVSDKINHAPPWQPTQASRVQAGCCKMCENFWHYHSCTVPAGCSPTPKSVKLELPDNSKPSEEVGEQPIGTVQLGLAGRRSRLPKALPGCSARISSAKWRYGTRGWLLCHIGWQYAQLAGDAAGLTGWQKRAPKLRSNNQTTDQATKNPAGAGVQLTRACFPAPAGQNHIKLS